MAVKCIAGATIRISLQSQKGHLHKNCIKFCIKIAALVATTDQLEQEEVKERILSVTNQSSFIDGSKVTNCVRNNPYLVK